MDDFLNAANFLRFRFLWQVAVQLANDPGSFPGRVNDMRISLGAGRQKEFQPSLQMATGTQQLAHDVCAGGLDMAFLNPSGLLTQAYRGTGVFKEALPVRVVACFPSSDAFVFMAHERTGLKTLQDLKDAKLPLKISIRENPTHTTRIMIDQILGAYGLTVADLEAWGGELVTCRTPVEDKRMVPMRRGELDLIADEGLSVWFDEALALGYRPLEFSDACFKTVTGLGWRRVVLRPGGMYKRLDFEHACFDFSGWPLYTRAELSADAVYAVCEAIAARSHEIPWEMDSYKGIPHPFTETPATPMDVPLHPGTERWLEKNARKG